jgi:hypothetical protein
MLAANQKISQDEAIVIEEIEISSLDLRYEGCRIKNNAAEKGLLASILLQGIREALQGSDEDGRRILLDGFMRYRCARRLGIATVPYESLGTSQGMAIVQIMRNANTKRLNILEQARFIEEVRNLHHMPISEIAQLLERSKSWVSLRTGIIEQMSQCVLEKIFSGEFPAYAYIYHMRRFIRIKCAQQKEIDEFVVAVAGKGLSIREIALLANGFFQGGAEFREQILRGDVAWGMKRLKESMTPSACNEFEEKMLRDLMITKKYIQRVSYKSKDERLKSNAVFSQASLLAGQIEKQISLFSKAIEELNDFARKA